MHLVWRKILVSDLHCGENSYGEKSYGEMYCGEIAGYRLRTPGPAKPLTVVLQRSSKKSL